MDACPLCGGEGDAIESLVGDDGVTWLDCSDCGYASRASRPEDDNE